MIVASWKQRRKQVPYRQPAGDGPAPGYTPTHTLSHSPTVSFFSILAQDFFFRAPWTAACLPFWREEMENRSHEQGCRKRLQTSRSGISAQVMQENRSQEWLHLVSEWQIPLIQEREDGKQGIIGDFLWVSVFIYILHVSMRSAVKGQSSCNSLGCRADWAL